LVLAARILSHGEQVTATIESMTGSRLVHDQLERWDWEVAIADPVKVKVLAAMAAKTDKIDRSRPCRTGTSRLGA
jgi:transposase